MKKQNEQGVSMVETAVACIMIVTVLAISLPMISNALRAYTLRSAADHVAERLSAVRALALAKNKNVTFSLNNSSQKYGFDFTSSTPGVPDGVPDTSDPDDPSLEYIVEGFPSGVTPQFPASAPIQVTFTSRGELPIGASAQDIVLKSGNRTATVSVNLRGRIYVH